MSLWDLLKAKKTTGYVDSGLEVEIQTVGSTTVPEKLTDINAFTLANTIPEIYYVVDFIADRASKLRYFIAGKDGKEIPNTELNRFVQQINPIYQFSDLVYQSVFSLLSDGNMIHYVQTPSTYRNVNLNSISRIDVLQPDLLAILEYTNLSMLSVLSLNDFIAQARYNDVLGGNNYLVTEQLKLYGYDSVKRDSSRILTRSPLFKASVAINNLLAVYSARYNVYVNNGAAGYLSKKTSTGVDSALANRDDILKDLNKRNGLTGKKNLWGISSVPLEFINTLVTIKDLLPLEETLENTIKIGSVYQIPAGLMPRKDQSTYNNQEADERSVWENTMMSVVDTFCEYWGATTGLIKAGYQVKADYSSVSVLNANEQAKEDVNSKKLDNLKKIKDLNPEADISKEIELITNSYGKTE